MAATNALLKSLTLAALSLPGVAPDIEAADAEYVDLNSQFSRYEESGNRMKIDVYQATALLPLTDRLSFKANGIKDIVSGASPVTNIPKLNNKPFQVMSGASIRDVRDSVDLNASYQHEAGTLGVGIGRSSENDYASNFFNIDSRLDFNQKTTTLETGYGFSSDSVSAIDRCPPHCIGSMAPAKYRRTGVGGDKSVHQGIVGVTQVLDKDSLLQANLTYTRSQGYLSDPYKVAYTPWVTTPYPGYSDFGGYSHDTRPGGRSQFAILTRYVRHFSALNAAALHLDYRFYADTWGINANTFEATWIQPIWQGWQISPKIRYYSQGSADFYQPFFLTPRADGLYSSDYRLAKFGALSGGVQLSKAFYQTVDLGFGIEFYERKSTSGFNSGIGDSIDNYTFSIYTAKINIKF